MTQKQTTTLDRVSKEFIQGGCNKKRSQGGSKGKLKTIPMVSLKWAEDSSLKGSQNSQPGCEVIQLVPQVVQAGRRQKPPDTLAVSGSGLNAEAGLVGNERQVHSWMRRRCGFAGWPLSVAPSGVSKMASHQKFE